MMILPLLAVSIFGQGGKGQDENVPTGTAPLTYGIVVDNSGTYRRILGRIIDTVIAIADEHSANDEAFLVTYVDVSKTAIRLEFTNEGQELREAAEEMYIQGGRTAVLDALLFSAKYLVESGVAADGRRKALLLISDGDDRESSAKFEEVADYLKKNNIRVFSIAIADGRVSDKLLTKIAKATGGKVLLPNSPTTTKKAVADIFADLRHN